MQWEDEACQIVRATSCRSCSIPAGRLRSLGWVSKDQPSGEELNAVLAIVRLNGIRVGCVSIEPLRTGEESTGFFRIKPV